MTETITFSVPTDWRWKWPLSKLAGCTVEMTEDDRGDLVDLRITSNTSNLSLADTSDIEAAELAAAREAFVYVPAAREMGEEMAKAAATWTTDGNQDVAERARVLAMLRDGDPEAYDYLPNEPNLSGEFADDPTPRNLFEGIIGRAPELDSLSAESEDGGTVDTLCTAFEDGVSEAFSAACEAELIKFCEQS